MGSVGYPQNKESDLIGNLVRIQEGKRRCMHIGTAHVERQSLEDREGRAEIRYDVTQKNCCNDLIF